ncbi:hypothetical protein B0H13DRAFT_2421472 [Mycena leptocephala]|nr:hypothetical protein B0H13DRAFT_2421472 [Mycena leptocephala]
MFPPLAASPPSLAADNNTCPWCLAGLKIQWCKSGPNKEKAFLVCEDIDLHPQRQRFWHWWGVVASHQARASLSLSPTLNLANTSFSFPSTAPPASSSAVGMTSTQTPALRCRYVNGCQSTCCKKHCIILNNGSCPLKTHDPATMSQRQRCDANVPPPLPARRHQTLFSPLPVASPPKSPVDGFSPSFLTAELRLGLWAVLQQARIDSPGLYLDQALHTGQSPLLPPSFSRCGRSRGRGAAARTHPLDGAVIRIHIHTSVVGGLFSILVAGGPPPSQPRVPASSVARKTTLPKPPRITTQLNPAWMSQATGTRPANIPLRGPHHGPTLYISVWDKDGKPPLILGVIECPSWPEFRLSDSMRTLNLLGSDLAAVEFYNIRFCLWTRVDIAYTHILTSTPISFSAASHIRYNLAAERVAVRNKIKARETQGTDDDDIEVVKVNGIKIEPIDKSPIADADIVEVMDCPPPARNAPRSASSLAAPALQLPTQSSSSTTSGMSATSGAPLKWPAGMYTVNMAQGFLRMEAADMQHIPLAERFQRVFKTSSEFKQRTYNDARLRWTRGSESLRTEALDAGRTKAGLWSLYAAQVPLKK